MRKIGFALTCLLLSEALTAQVLDPISATPDSRSVVLTPTRLKQSLKDVPASVTIITADQFQKFGLLTLPDVLRLVPGMQITQPSGGDYRINYHGSNVLSPRRLNVLIDGVSAYQPLFAKVDWANLPVTLEDIDRIEVTRGPNSAAYGPNSMMAIVNIITKHPADVERFMATTTQGGYGFSSTTARVGTTLGPAAVRLTLNHDQSDGFETLSRGKTDHDSTYIKRLNLRAKAPLGERTSLDVQIGYVEGKKEVSQVEANQVTYPDMDVRDQFLSGTLTHSFSPTHELQARAFVWQDKLLQSWRTCMPTVMVLPEVKALFASNPGYVTSLFKGKTPSGGSAQDDALALAASQAIKNLGAKATSPICSTANQNQREQRIDLELQDTVVWSDTLRWVAGGGLRRNSGESETFLGNSGDGRHNNIWRVFANAEYRPHSRVTLNLGAYTERDELTGTSTSPRAALNFHVTENQALRLVWSEGSRSPDVKEQKVNWNYTLRDADPAFNGSRELSFFQSARSPGGLKAERMISREIGYLVTAPQYGLLLDVKAFHEQLRDLISEKLQVSDFKPTNNGSVNLSGIEIQANMQLFNHWYGFAQYAYLSNENASTTLEQTQYSRHSGAMGLSHSFGHGWAASLAYYGASGNGLGESPYGRTDLMLSKMLAVGDSKLDLSLMLKRLDSPTQSYFRDFGSIYQSNYGSRYQFAGQAKIAF
jgi:iron complex outermembrane recepter protein